MSVNTSNLIKFGLTAVATIAFGAVVYQQKNESRNASRQRIEKIEGSLAKAEEIFKNFSTMKETDRSRLFGHLEKAFTDIQKLSNKGNFSSLLDELTARVFFLYGRTLYSKDMEQSRQILQLALSVQLVGLRGLNVQSKLDFNSTNSLAALPEKLSLHRTTFEQIDRLLALTRDDNFASRLCEGGMGDNAFTTGMILRFLGQSYQNIGKFKKVEHVNRFEEIYGLAEKIFKAINTKNSEWEIGQIKYNTGTFIHYLKNPGFHMGAIKLLEAIPSFLEGENNSVRSRELEAQILNKMATERGNILPSNSWDEQELFESRYADVSNAAEIAKTTPGFGTFLKTNLVHNKAALAIKALMSSIKALMLDANADRIRTKADEIRAKADEIRKEVQYIVDIMTSENYSNIYHPTYLINFAKFEISLAKFEIDQKRMDEAALHFQSAVELLQKAEDVTDRDPIEFKEEKATIVKLEQENSQIVIKRKPIAVSA